MYVIYKGTETPSTRIIKKRIAQVAQFAEAIQKYENYGIEWTLIWPTLRRSYSTRSIL